MSSPTYSYVFHDITIKFFVAITFYEVNVVYNRVVSNELTEGSWCHELQQLLNDITRENRLPLDYKRILNNIKIFLNLIVAKVSRSNNDVDTTTEGVEILMQRIVDQFTRIGVTFLTMDNEMETEEKSVEFFFKDIQNNIEHMFGSVVNILNKSLHLNL